MKEYTRKPRLSRETINRLMNGETVRKGIYEYSIDKTWNEKLKRYEETLYRWNDAIEEFECWILGWNGLYEFEVEKND
jgi:hypothetical protein|nr:MAG TPA: hypothetical protein [Microviridae sp.]